MLKILVVCMLTVFCRLVFCQAMSLTAAAELEQNLNTSISLERSDKELMRSWSQEYQVQQVNVTTEGRLQKLRHRNHVFRRNDSNMKWIECLKIHNMETRKLEQTYYENEEECLKVANSADAEKKIAVKQVEKQLRHWRKGYRYLKRLCQNDFFGNEDDIEECLMKRVQTDNYDQVLQRLVELKLKLMGELLLTLQVSISDLQNCLRVTISQYLEDLRSVMATLDKCYSIGSFAAIL